MFIGHFGTAFIGKKVETKPSLGTYFLAAQFIDLAPGFTIVFADLNDPSIFRFSRMIPIFRSTIECQWRRASVARNSLGELLQIVV